MNGRVGGRKRGERGGKDGKEKERDDRGRGRWRQERDGGRERERRYIYREHGTMKVYVTVCSER